MSADIVDAVPIDARTAMVYAEGWQSWSPARWYADGDAPAIPDERWQHLMRFRPGTAVDATGWQAEGLLVLDDGQGLIRAYAAPRPTVAVPTIRARRAREQVEIVADGDVVVVDGASRAAVLSHVAQTWCDSAALTSLRPAPTVWCTWYQYFEDVAVGHVLANLERMGDLELPVDVVQIDDGWSRGLGEFLAPADGIPDPAGLVARIRDSGRRAGVWLAPFVVGRETTLARRHPGWLAGDAGVNWGDDLVGLDLAHDDVLDLIRDAVGRVCGWGVDYLKLDFLYAGALPGPDGAEAAIAAYRRGLGAIRETAGPDTYLVGCGAPLLPSLGLLDAMRVSPDTFHRGGEDGSRGLRGRPALAARAWQHGHLWVNDPDCLVARPGYRLRESWADAVTAYGGLRASSDDLAALDAWGIETTRRVLSTAPGPSPLPAGLVERGVQDSRVPALDRGRAR